MRRIVMGMVTAVIGFILCACGKQIDMRVDSNAGGKVVLVAKEGDTLTWTAPVRFLKNPCGDNDGQNITACKLNVKNGHYPYLCGGKCKDPEIVVGSDTEPIELNANALQAIKATDTKTVYLDCQAKKIVVWDGENGTDQTSARNNDSVFWRAAGSPTNLDWSVEVPKGCSMYTTFNYKNATCALDGTQMPDDKVSYTVKWPSCEAAATSPGTILIVK